MSVLPVGISGEAQYQISRSLRFNSADSAYLNRTPSSAGNRRTWTWSGWVKRSALGTNQHLFMARSNGTNYDQLRWNSDNTFYFFGQVAGADSYRRNTTQVFRDTGAWYHIVAAFDSTQATASNRIKLYVNGVQITAFSASSDPTLNFDSFVNSTVVHLLGGNNLDSSYSDGYLTEVNFIDGQALTPSSFGETDAITGVWKPKKYTGTYGTNGFYLNFSDNSGTTATTLGKDYSGNGNNWTPNNFSVTAGAGNDSLVDVPTLWGSDTGAGGEVRGNYCTLNPLDISGGTLSNGNLQQVTPASGYGPVRGTIAVSSGKWYWEVVGNDANVQYGISLASEKLPDAIGATANSYAYYGAAGQKVTNNTYTSYGASFGNNDVIGVALDMDAGTLVFYKNGVSQGTAFTGLSGTFSPGVSDTSNSVSATITVNFGQRPFAYTAPSGFKALCTTNIAEGTITTSGSFTGNSSTDGPFVYLNGVPTAMSINGNAVTFGTHADKLSNGFKVRSSSSSYNTSGSNTYSITSTGAKFKYANAQGNP